MLLPGDCVTGTALPGTHPDAAGEAGRCVQGAEMVTGRLPTLAHPYAFPRGYSQEGSGGSFALVDGRPALLKVGTGFDASLHSHGRRGGALEGYTGTGTWGSQGQEAPGPALGATSLQKPARGRQADSGAKPR